MVTGMKKTEEIRSPSEDDYRGLELKSQLKKVGLDRWLMASRCKTFSPRMLSLLLLLQSNQDPGTIPHSFF